MARVSESTETQVRGKCAHCGHEHLRTRKLVMFDEYGAFGNAYPFMSYTCTSCGYSEFYAVD